MMTQVLISRVYVGCTPSTPRPLGHVLPPRDLEHELDTPKPVVHNRQCLTLWLAAEVRVLTEEYVVSHAGVLRWIRGKLMLTGALLPKGPYGGCQTLVPWHPLRGPRQVNLSLRGTCPGAPAKLKRAVTQRHRL